MTAKCPTSFIFFGHSSHTKTKLQPWDGRNLWSPAKAVAEAMICQATPGRGDKEPLGQIPV